MYTRLLRTLVLTLCLLNTPLFADCYMKNCRCTHVQYNNGDFSGKIVRGQAARERDRERNEYHYENKRRKHIRTANVEREDQVLEFCQDCHHLIEEHGFDDDY